MSLMEESEQGDLPGLKGKNLEEKWNKEDSDDSADVPDRDPTHLLAAITAIPTKHLSEGGCLNYSGRVYSNGDKNCFKWLAKVSMQARGLLVPSYQLIPVLPCNRKQDNTAVSFDRLMSRARPTRSLSLAANFLSIPPSNRDIVKFAASSLGHKQLADVTQNGQGWDPHPWISHNARCTRASHTPYSTAEFAFALDFAGSDHHRIHPFMLWGLRGLDKFRGDLVKGSASLARYTIGTLYISGCFSVVTYVLWLAPGLADTPDEN
ncbi:hypothetical protein V8B97DRAFT_1918990 [Scleroderma yunnanense]